jgi:N-acetylneuraminic acid mutarotase
MLKQKAQAKELEGTELSTSLQVQAGNLELFLNQKYCQLVPGCSMGTERQDENALTPMITARTLAPTSALKNEVVVIGGLASDGSTVLDVVESYDTTSSSRQWVTKPKLPSALCGAGAASLAGKLYVVGGAPDVGLTPTNAILAFDSSTLNWEPVPGMETPRWRPAVQVSLGFLYAIGGYITSDPVVSNQAEKFDPSTGKWSVLDNSNMTTPRCCMASATVGSSIYTIGGFTVDGKASAEVEILDTSTGAWLPSVPLPSARAEAQAIVLQSGNILVFGGTSSDGNILDSTIEFDLHEQTWINRTPVRVPRSNAGVAVVGQSAFVAGGTADWTNDPPAAGAPATNFTRISL